MTDKKTRLALLKLARKAIISSEDDKALDALSKPKIVNEKKGVFVTIMVGDGLHGCIGNLDAIDVHTGVIRYALFAAFNDPRFPPLQKKEFSKMKLHINLLGKPYKIDFKDTSELINKIKGKGVIVKKGFYSATFLPSVWEDLPEPESFLTHLCIKAGLAGDEWQHKGIEVEVYDSEEFSE